MSAGKIYKTPDGKYAARGSFVLSCGCGGTSANARNLLDKAGASEVPVIESGTHKHAKRYMEQVGLKILITELKRPKHSVLINVDTGRYVNLLQSKNNPNVYENIRKVINGIV